MSSIENANPNEMEATTPTKPRKRVSISPKKPIVHSPRLRTNSHFVKEDDNWSLDDSSDDECKTVSSSKTKKNKKKRRRRSSARFLRLSQGSAAANEEKEEEFASSEHLGEIYRQAIRMNAENKINAGNSWGLKLIENMDKFIEEDGNTPRENSKKEEKSRVNFTKASCTLDASVKIYSYRVDDVHLSSYRVLANLNRTDKKDVEESVEDGEGEDNDGVKLKRKERKGGVETIESNVANINMSKLDSAYDIDPLFHKMSKAFDEGGAKGLLLGNLGVSSKGCHIVFDSKELVGEAEEDIEGTAEEEAAEEDEATDKINLQEIDLTSFSTKLESLLASYSAPSVDTVSFVPQLQSLRDDYATLESEGYGVDEKEAAKEGRQRLRLYDAPEEEEKEAEKSIHHIALERSRGSVLGMSFDTNFRLSLGPDDEEEDGGFMAEEDGLGGEGEFAPVDFGGDDDGFAPDFEFQASEEAETFTDRQSYNNTKVLLDALCDGDAFYDDRIGGNNEYTFFDMKKFEKATDGNLWAGSQHWKKAPSTKSQKSAPEKRKVMFLDDGAETEKKTKKSAKKDRVFIDFAVEPDTESVFQKKSKAKSTRKKTPADPFQMAKTMKDFLLPPDANVNSSALTRLFSRPNAIVQKPNDTPKSAGKTVGFYDIEDNALGFDCDNDFGDENDTGGFELAYGDDDGGVDDDMEYRTDHFDEVRKVQKIDINYATVAKKVDVRRLKRDIWAELEEKTAVVPAEEFDEAKDQDDIYAAPTESRAVSFKETVENMEKAQSQHDVTVSYYFICCLHLANEKGLKLDSNGLEDFMISMNDGTSSSFKEMLQDTTA